MNKTVISMVTVAAMSMSAVAGGNIAPVEEPVMVVEPVVSDSGLYLGMAYGFTNSSTDHVGGTLGSSITYLENIDYGSLMFQTGYKFNEYVAVEGRYWLGFDKSAEDYVFGLTLDTNSDTWGVYVKPMYPVTEELNVYALLGYASTTFEATHPQRTFTTLYEPEGFSWGLGAEYEFTQNIAAFVDYVSMVDETTTSGTAEFDDKIYSVNVGLTYRF